MSAAFSRRRLLMGAVGLAPGAPRAEQADVTQADQFFVRDHFDEPDLSLATWKLRMEGRVAHPLELTFSDLLESPTVEQASILECAGNGESGAAVAWDSGRVSGCPHFWRWPALTLPEMCCSKEPTPVNCCRTLHELRTCGSCQGKKCRAPGSLVAFQLNGRFLPRRNGFPARVILPGWYGMDSVKWLQRIVVLSPGKSPPVMTKAE